jgi:hypothetical protein
MAHIRTANIIPYGKSVANPLSAWDNLKAGDLKKIHRYIEPSKQQDVKGKSP